MWVGCKGTSFHITVLVHTGPLSFGREIISVFGLRNLFMARCVLEHLRLYLFRVPSSTGSVGTYLASQSSHLNVFFCCCTCRRVFLFFLQNSHVPGMLISFCFCGPIFVQKYHARACCCRASLIPGIAATQALHSTSQTPHSAESQVRAHERATTQSSRQS